MRVAAVLNLLNIELGKIGVDARQIGIWMPEEAVEAIRKQERRPSRQSGKESVQRIAGFVVHGERGLDQSAYADLGNWADG